MFGNRELWKKDSIENGLLFLCHPQLCIAFLTTTVNMHAFEVIPETAGRLFMKYWGIMN